MIVDENGVIVDGLATAQTLGSFEFTGLMRTASTPEFSGDDPARPYYMGYVNDEDIPSILHYCTWNVDTENGKIKIEHYHENRPWAYAALQSTNVDMFGCGLANDGNGNWNYAAGTSGSYRVVPRLINAGIMARNTMSDDILIRFTEHLGTGVNTYKATYPQTYGYLWMTNLDNLQKFVDGDVTYTYTSSFANTSITVSISDFDEYGVAHVPSTAGTLHLMIQGFNRCGRSDTEGNSFRILPFYRATIGSLNRYAYQFFDGFYSQGGHVTEPTFYIDRTSFAISSYVYNQSGQYMGLPEFEIDTDQLTNVVTNSNGLIAGPYFIRYYATSQYVINFPVATIQEILKYANLSNKFQKGINYNGQNTTTPTASTTYTTSHSVALFNSDNSPKNERISENYGITMIRKLQEWQLPGIDVKINSFDSDTDIPGGGGGGGDDTPGNEPKNLPDIAGADEDMQDDAVLVSPAMFITQYILSSAQLRSLGENLWTSWLTPSTDVWKNFWYNFSAQADTGTCDIGAVLNFITSLKVFPFNLAAMSFDYLGATDGIYIGTGHTNFLPGNTAILNTVIGYLDAGTVDVNLQHPYSDFRDYYNCSVMIFLPFCGTVQVNPVEVIGRTLHAKYYIDFQSGACTAVVLTSNGEHEYILCSKSGQIGFSIPITATNAGQLAARFAGDAVQTVGTLSGLFFNIAGNVANSAEQMAKALAFNKTAGEGKEGKVPTGMTATSALNVGKAGVDAGLNLAEQAIDRLSRSAVDMPMLSGGSGCESLFQPSHAFVQIRRGKYAKPDNYPHSVAHLNLSSNPISYYKGKYSGTPSTGSDTDKGFCVFTNVDTSGLNCREDERAEIVALLESGIYL